MQLKVDSRQIPVGWEIKKLGDVCHAIGGGTPSKSNEEFYTGEIPWATVRDMKNEFIFETECRITEEAVKKSSTNIIKKGNIVIATRVGLGKVCMVAQDTAINQDLRGIIPKNHDQILVRFLFWWLKSIAHLIKEEGTGATVQGVKVTFVNSLKILIPTISEQKRIVAILDEAFEGIDRAIANTEKNLVNSRELFESYLNAIFTQKNNRWEWVRLSEITTDITDGDHQPPPKSQSGIPFITISNIDKQNRKVDFSNTFKVPPEYFEKLKSNRKPRKGDLLYTVTGSYGIPVIVDHDIDFCFQRHIGLIRPNAETNSKCLYYILLSRYLLTQADECATGTAQKTVSLSGLRRFSVPKIPKEQQEIIVTELDALSEKIGRLETIYRQKIAALTELKQSILQKAFTGELTADTANQTTKAAQRVNAA